MQKTPRSHERGVFVLCRRRRLTSPGGLYASPCATRSPRPRRHRPMRRVAADEPACARIPGAACFAGKPAPIRRERQHQPQRLAQRAGNVRDSGIDGYHAVQTIDDRRGIGEIFDLLSKAMNRRARGCVSSAMRSSALNVGLQHDPVDAFEREQRIERGERHRTRFVLLDASRPRDADLALGLAAERAAPFAADRRPAR